ncbi:MAG TPA: calcium/proton exchanger [Gaiellaceae bacterium]|nr:calcium/proton exchanger [Gaiellaceae bacterium]
MARRILWASLALAPVTIAVDRFATPGETTLFVLSAASLVPLAWLIGESTEHAAEHTGPGIGGFLNASFGNAPELIIALFAISDGLPQVVRGSLAGSVISNLLLVFGLTVVVGPEKTIDLRSLSSQLGLVGLAVVALVPVAVLGYTGSPERHTAVVVSIPIAVGLLAVYLVVTTRNLRRHHRLQEEALRRHPRDAAWSLPTALVVLGIATVFTAFVSEILVHSLAAFSDAAGLSEFFVAAVIVAIVGNAAEHGGALVIAHAGDMRLASEIAISSSAQVALLVAPVVMLISLAFSNPLPLSFRWEELVALAGAVLLAGQTIRDGRTTKREGVMLLLGYAVVVGGFLVAGNR